MTVKVKWVIEGSYDLLIEWDNEVKRYWGGLREYRQCAPCCGASDWHITTPLCSYCGSFNKPINPRAYFDTTQELIESLPLPLDGIEKYWLALQIDIQQEMLYNFMEDEAAPGKDPEGEDLERLKQMVLKANLELEVVLTGGI